jgi:hypothetical protein
MPLPTAGYCSDEDLALRAGADFGDLVPGDQSYAAGNDGTFSPSDRWTLASASADFAGQGVAAGMVALIALPRRGIVPETQQLVVASVSGAGATLRRKGFAPGVGQPPAPPEGCDGVQFTVATLRPQILAATYDLNRRYGVDDLVLGRRTSDLYDPTELIQACVLTVLVARYHAVAKAADPETKDGGDAPTLWGKARQYKRELEELLARVALHWIAPVIGPGAGDRSPTTRFGMRLSR